MGGVSITDIAKKSGVSKTTVSMVLNDRGKEYSISDKVIQRVRETANQLNYKPNRLARSLRTGSTKVIGVIVLDLANKFHSKLSRAIEDCSAEHGYRVMVCSSDEKDIKLEEWIDELVDNRVEGLIITPTENAREKIVELKKRRFPFVLVDRTFTRITTDYVGTNSFKASSDALNHMIHNGYRKIGIIAFNPNMTHMKERIEGYKSALRAHGIRSSSKLIRTISYENIEDQVKKHLKDLVQEENVRAILFATNRIGIIGLKTLYEMKIRIPKDIAVVTYDDNEFFPIMQPSITAIAQPIEEIGRKAVGLLISKLLDGREGYEQLRLDAKLVVRDSC